METLPETNSLICLPLKINLLKKVLSPATKIYLVSRFPRYNHLKNNNKKNSQSVETIKSKKKKSEQNTPFPNNSSPSQNTFASSKTSAHQKRTPAPSQKLLLPSEIILPAPKYPCSLPKISTTFRNNSAASPANKPIRKVITAEKENQKNAF